MHEHPDYAQVLFTDADAKATTEDGKVTENKAKAGDAAWRTSTKHQVENMSDQPFEGIVEIKPTARPAT